MGVSGMLVRTVMVGGEKFYMFKLEFEKWKRNIEIQNQVCFMISLDLEYPLISNKSSVAGYLLSICLSPNPSFNHASNFLPDGSLTEFRQPIQVQSHLEMPGILVQLGCIQRT